MRNYMNVSDDPRQAREFGVRHPNPCRSE
jgi:hypothetical protein